MKIINNTEINSLILFSKKNLGIYKLVYSHYKKIYWTSILFASVSLCLLIMYIFLAVINVKPLVEKLIGIICLAICLCTLYFFKLVDKKTADKHLVIQKERFNKLKEYYVGERYNVNDIKVINEQLQKRVEKIEKQKITILVVIGALIMPVWDMFIQNYFNDFSSDKIAKRFVFILLFSFIVLMLIRVLNKTIYLYEENVYVKNNVALIDNLIYLNNYIIQEMEE